MIITETATIVPLEIVVQIDFWCHLSDLSVTSEHIMHRTFKKEKISRHKTKPI